jgi:hypothetical protein
MKEEAATGALLRQFLLGKLEDEERQQIETLFLIDSVMRERVLAAEQELIDDYLENCLSPAEREAFLSLYGDSTAQRRKLRIAKSIQQWAVNQPKTPPVTAAPASSSWSRLLDRLRLKPVLVVPIVVATIIAIVVVVVWFNRRGTDDAEYLAMQQQLAQVNTPSSLREFLPEKSVVTLKPGTIRSTESQAELKRYPDSRVAELRLLWMQNEDYPSYQAVLRVPGATRSYTIPNLTAENGKFIRVRLPLPKLPRGNYQIELTGVAADSTRSSTEIFSFTLSD